MADRANHTYSIEFITPLNHQRRGVAFLISEDGRITAKDAFDELGEKWEKHLRARFDWWVGGHNKPDCYHGWNKSEAGGKYTSCFVFEYKAKRFYGFLCNPKKDDRRYQLCILINNDVKHRHNTDPQKLEEIEQIRTTLKIYRSIENSLEILLRGNNEQALDGTEH